MELLALLALGLAIAALVKSSGGRTELDELQRQLRLVRRDIEKLSDGLHALREEGVHPERASPAEPVIVDMIAPGIAPEPFVAPAPEPALSKETPPPPPPREAVAAKSLEETLTANWLVWIGALAIALAGTFLVRYAIESGLLGPGARVTLGFLLGVALAAAASGCGGARASGPSRGCVSTTCRRRSPLRGSSSPSPASTPPMRSTTCWRRRSPSSAWRWWRFRASGFRCCTDASSP